VLVMQDLQLAAWMPPSSPVSHRSTPRTLARLQSCLHSKELQSLLTAARRASGLCPLCYENRLLPTPVEFEPPNETVKKARELMAHAQAFGVAVQGMHGDHVEDDAPLPPGG